MNFSGMYFYEGEIFFEYRTGKELSIKIICLFPNVCILSLLFLPRCCLAIQIFLDNMVRRSKSKHLSRRKTRRKILRVYTGSAESLITRKPMVHGRAKLETGFQCLSNRPFRRSIHLNWVRRTERVSNVKQRT